MGRLLIVLYGVASYGIFFLTFLYMIAWLGNLGDLPYVADFVTKTIDSGEAGALVPSIAINVGLILIFGLSHTVMARPAFKEKMTKIIPAAAERSTYVLVASLALILMFAKWQPMTGTIWDVSGPTLGMVLLGFYFLGFGIVLLSTFLINHFELFGLHQIYANMTGGNLPTTKFVQPLLYKFVRHPLYTGFAIAFWATPHMTTGHLLFAVCNTAYLLFAIPYEERDLEDALGDEYREYKKSTPMLVPFIGGRK